MTKFNVISADSHVVEPGDLWTKYMEPAFKERAPYCVREGENDVFKAEGVSLIQVAAVSGAGRPSDQLKSMGSYEKDSRPGAWDPNARIEDMEADGVEAEVIYPSVALRMFGISDLPYQLACFRAYNSWLADFVKVHPDLFRGIGLVPIDDIEAAVTELHRCKEIGLGGISITVNPVEGLHYDNPVYYPLWAAAESNDMPVSLHILTERRFKLKTGLDSLVGQVLDPGAIQECLTRMIFSGVFVKYPGLKVVSAENDIGWAGYFVERMDYLFDRRRAFQKWVIPQETNPSEYVKRNCFLTFMRDRAGILVRDIIGVDNIMWSSDYPHLDSTWPNSQKMIEYLCGDIPAEDRRKIVAENAARLYGFD